MGSLMAGWDSPVLKSKHGTLDRSSSFTKYEIEEFRNKQKLAEEDHLKAAALIAENIRRARQADGSVDRSKITAIQIGGDRNCSGFCRGRAGETEFLQRLVDEKRMGFPERCRNKANGK